MSRAAAAPKKAVPMCCVSIGHRNYLMPVDKGMKLVELMQFAFETDKGFGERDYTYQIGEQPSVEFSLVKPAQIKPRATNADGQFLIGGS
jgi:hypothetical protein